MDEELQKWIVETYGQFDSVPWLIEAEKKFPGLSPEQFEAALREAAPRALAHADELETFVDNRNHA
ncbi:hypothetical protein [Rhizobium sp. Root1203]|uniref:hypothetical protein n=1 Tax=Rhizobium sp. Root1203 TaxID=1736427 RepID=UPI0012E3BFAF|nr:hypothetical protein [Rhizobium sp. Root1203]